MARLLLIPLLVLAMLWPWNVCAAAGALAPEFAHCGCCETEHDRCPCCISEEEQTPSAPLPGRAVEGPRFDWAPEPSRPGAVNRSSSLSPRMFAGRWQHETGVRLQALICVWLT